MGQRQTELKTDSTGNYFRQLGRKAGLAGQPKFRLGSDPDKAQLAYARLGALWTAVVAEHESGERAYARGDFDDVPATLPAWADDTLAMANAIRLHQPSIKVGPPAHVEGPAAYLTYLDALRQRYGHVIAIVAADGEAADAGRLQH